MQQEKQTTKKTNGKIEENVDKVNWKQNEETEKQT